MSFNILLHFKGLLKCFVCSVCQCIYSTILYVCVNAVRRLWWGINARLCTNNLVNPSACLWKPCQQWRIDGQGSQPQTVTLHRVRTTLCTLQADIKLEYRSARDICYSYVLLQSNRCLRTWTTLISSQKDRLPGLTCCVIQTVSEELHKRWMEVGFCEPPDVYLSF